MAPAWEKFPITVPVLALDDTVFADKIFINITPTVCSTLNLYHTWRHKTVLQTIQLSFPMETNEQFLVEYAMSKGNFKIKVIAAEPISVSSPTGTSANRCSLSSVYTARNRVITSGSRFRVKSLSFADAAWTACRLSAASAILTTSKKRSLSREYRGIVRSLSSFSAQKRWVLRVSAILTNGIP